MRYRGRQIDPIALWERYVEFPTNMRVDDDDVFLPLVQCPNPEHDTLKKHFQINIRDGLVHCFARCGISGSFEHAVSMIENCTPREARKVILKNARVQNFSSRRVRGSKGGRRPTSSVSPDELRYDTFLPQLAMEYLGDRQISSASIAQWQLGWLANDKRIAIPAKDATGRTRFLIKRAVLEKQHPKYLYTEGFAKTALLFGTCEIDTGLLRSLGLVLTEGSLDVIRLHQNGIRNSVAILGTGISDQQRQIVSLLRPRKLYLMFDKDLSGLRNVEICSKVLRKYPMYVCRYPKGKSDPAELSQREVERSIEKAIPVSRFLSTTGLNVNRSERNFVG